VRDTYRRFAGGASWNRTSDLSTIGENREISHRLDSSHRVPVSLLIGIARLWGETRWDAAGCAGTPLLG
jgi:hypothetical protein